jgi:hypothetical protein
MGIHLVRVEHADTGIEPQVDTKELNGVTGGNSRMVPDLVLVNGLYVVIWDLDDEGGPLPEED